MKTYLTKAIAFAIVITTCYNCSVESVNNIETQSNSVVQIDPPLEVDDVCVTQDPQAKMTNNSLLNANFEVFNQSGTLITHDYGVLPGAESSVLSFTSEIVKFVISTSESIKEIEIDMGNCMVYEVTIDEDNQLDTDQPIQL